MTPPSPGAWHGASSEEWAARLAVPLFEIHDELASTNDRLRALASQGASPFTAVVAREQTRGRGRVGRSWHSASDSGLWISILLQTPAPERPGVLTLAVGVAIARAIESAAGVSAALKWPNDVLSGGRKVSGILCETSGDAAGGTPPGGNPRGRVVAGIGINLRRPPDLPRSLDESAGFLEEVAGRPVPEPELAARLVEELRGWAAPAPATLTPALRAEWEPRDHLAGKRIVLDDGGAGTCRGIEDDGALRVEGENGELRLVRSGGVRGIMPKGEGR